MVKLTKWPLCEEWAQRIYMRVQVGMCVRMQAWGHECLCPSIMTQALVPGHKGARACAQTIWWNFYYLIFDLVFWFSVPPTFEPRDVALVPGYENLHPHMRAQTLAPGYESTRACVQATWWIFHYLISGLMFWFSTFITLNKRAQVFVLQHGCKRWCECERWHKYSHPKFICFYVLTTPAAFIWEQKCHL